MFQILTKNPSEARMVIETYITEVLCVSLYFGQIWEFEVDFWIL